MDENKKVVVACDQCRKNKKKCSGGPPPCESCQLKKIECFIPEERKKNKRLIEISEKLQELELEFQKLPSPESVNRSGSEPLIESSFNLNSLIIKPIYYHLVDCYLNTVQKLKPFISLTRINKELNSDPEKSPLINSICCIAYKYSNSLNSLIQPQTPSNCNSVFYERAIGILSSGKYESSIELVQSYLILSSYMSSFCLNEKSDSYLASAISIAKILGLHDQSWYFSDPSTHTEEKFEGAATWAICYYIDSNNAILLGKPYIMTYHMDGDNSDKFYKEMAKVRLEPHLENFRVCALYYGTSKYMSTLMLLRQKFYDKSLDLNTLREDYQNEETKAKKLFPAHFDKEYFFNTTIEQDPTILNYRNLKLVVGLNRVMSLLVSIKLNNQGYYKDMDQRIEELQEFFSIFTHRIPGYWLKFDLLDSNNSFVSYHLLQVTKQFPDYFENYSKVISELLANIAMTLKFHPEIRHHIENLIDISIAHIVRLAVDK